MRMLAIVVGCACFVQGPLVQAQEDAEAHYLSLDAAFHETFDALAERPLELQARAQQLIMEALEAEDCDAALVAHSLKMRASMLLGSAPSLAEDSPTLPGGCAETYPRLNYDIGCRLQAMGELDRATARLEAAGTSPKWASHAMNMVGSIRAQQKDYPAAIAAWEAAQAAVQGIPNPSIYINLGQMASLQGDWAAALHYFNLALEAQTWNEREQAYTFLQDIRPIIHTNILRAAVNVRDTVQADRAWLRIDPLANGNQPLIELRTMLDYLLWRNRLEVVAGLVEHFESLVAEDSLAAVEALNDRVLLFARWRNATHWEVGQTAAHLATAEQSPQMAFILATPATSNLPKLITSAAITRISWFSWAALVALAGWAAVAWVRVLRLNRQQRRVAGWSDAELFEQLASAPANRTVAANVLMGVLLRRLEESTLEFRLPKDILKALDTRELHILQAILNGKGSHEIAEELGVTVQRVYNIRSTLRAKVGLEPGAAWSDLVNQHAS